MTELSIIEGIKYCLVFKDVNYNFSPLTPVRYYFVENYGYYAVSNEPTEKGNNYTYNHISNEIAELLFNINSPETDTRYFQFICRNHLKIIGSDSIPGIDYKEFTIESCLIKSILKKDAAKTKVKK